MILLVLACTTEPSATSPADPNALTDDALPSTLADAVTIDALHAHLLQLETIADAAAGQRAFLTDGYLDSITYVEDALLAAGLTPVRDPFPISEWALLDVDVQLTDIGSITDRQVLTYSGGGTVTGTPIPVDLQLPPGPSANSSTSGCEPTDFEGFPAGSIALLQRGTCTFSAKAANAEAAGASAVLIFNEGQSGRTGTLEGGLDAEVEVGIPVIGLSFARGEQLAAGDVEVTATVDISRFDGVDENLLVTIPGRTPAAGTLLVGAHLDSVAAGPGVNDNGSGSAFLLETALAAVGTGWTPERDVTFAWWGAEEQGLVGSRNWIYPEAGAPADASRLDPLVAYLNFDMMASPAGDRFVYDGDNSDIQDDGGSAASGRIEDLFLARFDAVDLSTEPEGMFVASDSYFFVLEGVPTGGVFSGAGGPWDVCYHLACDRVEGLDMELYGQMATASAGVIQDIADAPVDRSIRARLRRDPGDRAAPLGCHLDPRVRR